MFSPRLTATCIAILAVSGIARARPDYVYAGPAVDIPDGSGTATPGTAASISINVPDTATIAHLTCSVYIPHGFQGDLVVTLTHLETGHAATLIDRPGYPQSPLGFPATDYGTPATSLLLDDSAATVYDLPLVPPSGISGVSGAWRPQSALSVFNGESTLGTWRLTATDNAGGDTGSLVGFKLSITTGGVACYVNCDSSTANPFLNVADFQCFLNKYAAGDSYANCDQSTSAPILNIVDFQCFLNKYAAGCSAP